MDPTLIAGIDLRLMDVKLRTPFGIATGTQTQARNLLVCVTLENGVQGWGEAAPFPAFNRETQAQALGAVQAVAPALLGRDARAWRRVGPWLQQQIPDTASARCAIETAVIDALARHSGIPVWVMLGGWFGVVETDMTVTTGSVDSARDAATALARDGYRTAKLKVGGGRVKDDIARAEAVIAAAPECSLIFDANGGMRSVDDALALVDASRAAGGKVVLFEQPLSVKSLAGMRELVERAGVPIAADESVSTVADVVMLAREKAAHVVNLKITKSGVSEVLAMAATAKALGLRLMIGGMVETAVAITMSASIAAGLGGFEFVDLDTPSWMVDAPVTPGYVQTGARLDLRGVVAGHGATVHADAANVDNASVDG